MCVAFLSKLDYSAKALVKYGLSLPIGFHTCRLVCFNSCVPVTTHQTITLLQTKAQYAFLIPSDSTHAHHLLLLTSLVINIIISIATVVSPFITGCELAWDFVVNTKLRVKLLLCVMHFFIYNSKFGIF